MKKRLPSDSQLESAARSFKLLSEPLRLKILRSICEKPQNVGTIVEKTGASQANVSKHLSLLFLHGIVSKERRGNEIYYGIADALMMQLCELVCSHVKGRSP